MARTDAQRVVLELIRSAGGAWEGKAKLSQAFYFAHLYYSQNEPGILTDWPIVRTPRGPGIQNSSVLLRGLVKNGYVTVEPTHEGPYPDSRYRLTDKAAEPPLPEEVRAAVKAAADFVLPRTAAELSALTQDRSRSWRAGKDGDTLDIYIDLIPEDEFEQGQEQLADLDRHLTATLLDEQMASPRREARVRSQVKAFKAAAIHACHLKGFSFTEFMEDWGLEDILIEADRNDTRRRSSAARVLADCCVSSGKFNNFQVGLLAVLKYLNHTFGPLKQGQQQSIQDLLAILNGGGSSEAILGWMNTHYP